MDMRVPFYADFASEAGYAIGLTDRADAVAVLRRHLESHYAVLHQRLARYLQCADLASESLHDAWLRLGDMAVPACVLDPGAYVYRVARNTAVDRLRCGHHTVLLGDIDSEIDLPDPQPGPERTAQARSALAQLERTLSGLPFRHRCVLFDLRVEGQTRAQVAKTYGLSLRNIDTMLRQTLERCARAAQAPAGMPAHVPMG